MVYHGFQMSTPATRGRPTVITQAKVNEAHRRRNKGETMQVIADALKCGLATVDKMLGMEPIVKKGQLPRQENADPAIATPASGLPSKDTTLHAKPGASAH